MSTVYFNCALTFGLSKAIRKTAREEAGSDGKWSFGGVKFWGWISFRRRRKKMDYFCIKTTTTACFLKRIWSNAGSVAGGVMVSYSRLNLPGRQLPLLWSTLQFNEPLVCTFLNTAV